jgi:hypothetical protein
MSELDKMLAQQSEQQLRASLLAEIAKSTNEIRCARKDIDKASSRLGFLTALANEMINRQGDSK